MFWKKSFCILIILFLLWTCSSKKVEDEDFADFDEFDLGEETQSATTTTKPAAAAAAKPDLVQDDQIDPSESKQDEVIIQDEDDDDELTFDDEEFEIPDSYSSSSSSTPDLKIAEVPVNLIGNSWERYQYEAVMLIILLGYLINFLVGRTKNARLADIIYQSQQDLLQKNFSSIGDNTQTSSDNQLITMQKEADHFYILWCTGRVAIESMLIEVRFLKRQCLFNSLAALIKSINDTLVYTIDFSKDELETFVFCLAKKRSATKLHRDMTDLNQFCVERKPADKKGLPGNYQILSEIGDVTSPLLDGKLTEFIDRYPDALEYLHISDQYTGIKVQNSDAAPQQQEASNVNERAVRRVLIVAFNLVPKTDRSLSVTCEVCCNDYLRLVLYLIDRLSTFCLASKESKSKALKNRQRIEEQFLKNINLQRQEQAQQRREEKRREEKEKMMQSDDPEMQRKWEEKEYKKEMKRRQPKMKQMKVKAM